MINRKIFKNNQLGLWILACAHLPSKCEGEYCSGYWEDDDSANGLPIIFFTRKDAREFMSDNNLKNLIPVRLISERCFY